MKRKVSFNITMSYNSFYLPHHWTNFVLQQDNDPERSSKLCTNYVKSKEYKGILHNHDLVPQSSDHSPTEIVWDEIDPKVQSELPKN